MDRGAEDASPGIRKVASHDADDHHQLTTGVDVKQALGVVGSCRGARDH